MPANILVVRGSKGFIQRLRQTMGTEHTIRQEISDAAALLYVESANPDIVLFFPPSGTSRQKYALCSIIRNSPRRQEIPIVVMAGRFDLQSKMKAFEAGATDYRIKPFAPAEVVTCISSLVSLRRVQNKLLTQRLELAHTKFMFLKGMAILAETRDPETGDHLLRVARYMKILAARAKDQETSEPVFDREGISEISRAAILHDIGKVGVPDNILLKPGKLSSEEFEVMQQHALYGERIIKKLLRAKRPNPFLAYAAEIAGGHHECWDGSGYPRGLKETETPLSARLMAVADVYDSIISPRVYKQAQTHNDAVEFIMDNKGKKFDPAIAAIFYAHKEKFAAIARQFTPNDLTC